MDTHKRRWTRSKAVAAVLVFTSFSAARPVTAALDVDGFPVDTLDQRDYVLAASVASASVNVSLKL
jgi:hypothetical protein